VPIPLLMIFLALVGSTPAQAQSNRPQMSPKDFDFVCAVIGGQEMGAGHNENNARKREVGGLVHSFYLGRLTGRDDTTEWQTLIGHRIARMKERPALPEVLSACYNFYSSKLK